MLENNQKVALQDWLPARLAVYTFWSLLLLLLMLLLGAVALAVAVVFAFAVALAVAAAAVASDVSSQTDPKRC